MSQIILFAFVSGLCTGIGIVTGALQAKGGNFPLLAFVLFGIGAISLLRVAVLANRTIIKVDQKNPIGGALGGSERPTREMGSFR